LTVADDASWKSTPFPGSVKRLALWRMMPPHRHHSYARSCGGNGGRPRPEIAVRETDW